MPTSANKRFDPEDFLNREDFRARFEAEKLAVERHYCTLFRFWSDCRSRPCRKARACKGDAHACLMRSIDGVARMKQFFARENLLNATAKNLPAPERAARLIFPNTFADNSSTFARQEIPRGWTRRDKRRQKAKG